MTNLTMIRVPIQITRRDRPPLIRDGATPTMTVPDITRSVIMAISVKAANIATIAVTEWTTRVIPAVPVTRSTHIPTVSRVILIPPQYRIGISMSIPF